jgi:hypothetical protein
MTVLPQQDIARPVSSNWPAPTDHPVLDAVLSGLERLGAALPHALAVPVMLAHEALCTLAERR